MECRKCHTQYIGKSETLFNIRLNNHKSNAYKPTNDSFPACKHFYGDVHDFNRDTEFTIIEQIRDTNQNTKKQINYTILQRENFWITKLKTLTLYGFNSCMESLPLSCLILKHLVKQKDIKKDIKKRHQTKRDTRLVTVKKKNSYHYNVIYLRLRYVKLFKS